MLKKISLLTAKTPHLSLWGLTLLLAACSAPSEPVTEQSSERPAYPITRTVNHSDTYHGQVIADPYRWLEADVREDAEVKTWVEQQAKYAADYLNALPNRADLRERVNALWYRERYSAPQKKDGRYFYRYTDGRMNQSQVFMSENLQDEPRLLFDPNTWSEDGTTALAAYYPAPAGGHVAYMVQEDGSDWRTIRVRNIISGKDTLDVIEDIKFSAISWLPDGTGFFYSKFDVPAAGRFHSKNENSRIFFHRLGTNTGDDPVIYGDPEHPDWNFFASVSSDGRYLVIGAVRGTSSRYRIYLKDLREDSAVRPMVTEFTNDYTFIDHVDGELLFRTDLDAPLGRVIAMNVEDGSIREIVGQGDSVLQSASHYGNRLVLHYLEDASSRVRVHDLTSSTVTDIQLPGIGSVAQISGQADDSEMFYSYSSMNNATTIRRVEFGADAQSTFKDTELAVDLSDVVVSQEFYTSKDGTTVPMFIMHKKDLPLDGSHPTLLYGYGGFNISLTPGFSTMRAVFAEQGGVVAVANLRGGGEYGEQWHAAGTRLNKQNVFDDFIGAAEHLIERKYTSAQHLGIMGGSNGGLLVGAVLNQRPDLFGAALPLVGVMDMLRFEAFTAGRYWVDDYGSVSDPEEFAALLAYSPYHNIQDIAYPPVLVGTADTDDRVVPGHSFKYAARLQEKQQGEAPILLRVDMGAGHGSGVPTSMAIDRTTDHIAFLFHHLQ